ncbi:hypothetical protein FACS1894196_4080 [Clostridia bacterium]|nr:hypothetical protein FACS1894196_4080 [Clostridia bacterium]
MAGMEEGTAYQVFEMHYKSAKEAERNGKMLQAKKAYLMAGEALLRAAKKESGELRKVMIARADRLQVLADSIDVPAEIPARPKQASHDANHTQRSATGIAAQRDESITVWTQSEKPNVRFDDVAGLADVKESINIRVIQPRLHPEIYEAFHRKSGGGILLYGPPGTGKTMIAKAIATEIDADFFAVRCSDIVGKYFGEAEKNIKGLFETARSRRSSIIFFDEFEALAAHRGGHSTVMNRLVPELLSQIDGFSVSDSNSLLFLAATNRPWDIDSAFLRPPRLTQKIYVGLPDYEARLYLIEKYIGQVPHDDDVDPAVIAELTEGYNAADVCETCEVMTDDAIRRSIEQKTKNENASISNVTLADVTETLARARSTVQRKDIVAIERWEVAQGLRQA